MWRQYAGYKNLPKPPESEGERLARERGVNSWPWRRIIAVEHVPYTPPPSRIQIRYNGRIPRPATHETIETLECGHIEKRFGWYRINNYAGLITEGYDNAGHRRCHPCAVTRFDEEAAWAAERGLSRP